MENAVKNNVTLNNVQLYFGTVVDIKDDLHLNRVRCTIQDYTEELSKDDLPWYYPIMGQTYLPKVGDTLAILVIGDNIATGFYFNNKINLKSRVNEKSIADGEEYETYLEVYDNKDITVQFTYKSEIGWELRLKESQIKIDKSQKDILIKTKNEHIHLTDDRIEVGNKELEPTPKGDQTVEALNNNLQLMMEKYDECMLLFEAIKKASSNPFLLPIKLALTALLPTSTTKFKPKQVKNKLHIDTKVRSKKVFNE